MNVKNKKKSLKNLGVHVFHNQLPHRRHEVSV